MSRIPTTEDAKLVQSWTQQRAEEKLNHHIERSTLELAQAQLDLQHARREADDWAIRESEARDERDKLTRAFDLKMTELFEVFTQAAVFRNHCVSMSNEERRARAQLQHAKEMLADPTKRL